MSTPPRSKMTASILLLDICFCSLQYFFRDQLRCDARKARVSPDVTIFTTVHGTRSARKLLATNLHNTFFSVSERTKSHVRMRASPNGKQRNTGQCGEVHIGCIHTHHEVQLFHQCNFLAYL